jgi:hypothetical protein
MTFATQITAAVRRSCPPPRSELRRDERRDEEHEAHDVPPDDEAE